MQGHPRAAVTLCVAAKAEPQRTEQPKPSSDFYSWTQISGCMWRFTTKISFHLSTELLSFFLLLMFVSGISVCFAKITRVQ